MATGTALRDPSKVIKLDGFKEFEERLKKMKGRALLDAVAESAYVAVDPALATAIALAPRRGGSPNRLAGSIRKAIISRGEGGIVSVSVGATKPGFYARFVEYGTRPHFSRRNGPRGPLGSAKIHPGSAARPFIRPAWEQNISRILEIFRTELGKRLGW